MRRWPLHWCVVCVSSVQTLQHSAAGNALQSVGTP